MRLSGSSTHHASRKRIKLAGMGSRRDWIATGDFEDDSKKYGSTADDLRWNAADHFPTPGFSLCPEALYIP